jgi:sugar phosphate isomerase/epimerase
MHKNLNTTALGISGRQSEVIELAMTYGFRSIDIDVVDLIKRSERSSLDGATRFLTSSKVSIGSFDIPINMDASEEEFAKKLAELSKVTELASHVGAQIGVLQIPAATDRLPYHEYFEVLRKRVAAIAKEFAAKSLNVALNFSAALESRANKQFKFISDVEGFVTFAKLCAAPNVGIVVDSWNWTVGGGTLDQLANLAVEKIYCVRLASAPEEFDVASASNDNRAMPSKDGLVQNVAMIKKLYAEGYRSSVTGFPSPAALGGKTRDAALANVVESLDEIFAAAEVPVAGRKTDAQPMLAGR